MKLQRSLQPLTVRAQHPEIGVRDHVVRQLHLDALDLVCRRLLVLRRRKVVVRDTEALDGLAHSTELHSTQLNSTELN